MSENVQTIDIQTLSLQAIPSIGYDPAGKLVFANHTKVAQKSSIKKLKIKEKAHLKSAIYWLKEYQPIDSSPWEQVKGYVEAFYHLCKIEAWQEAHQIFSLRVPFLPNYTLYENLGLWGYYREQIEIGEALLSKIDVKVDCLCLFELGNSHRYLGQYQTAFDYHQKLSLIATEHKNLTAMCQFYGGMGKTYFQVGNINSSINYQKKRLKLSQEIQNLSEQTQALMELARCYDLYGKSRKSNFYLYQATCKVDRVDNLKIKTELWLDIGTMFILSKNYIKAIDYLGLSLKSSEILCSKQLILKSLSFLGLGQAMSKNLKEGIKNIERATELSKQVGDLFTEMVTLNNLSVVYYTQYNDFQQAIEYSKKALKINSFLENPIINPYLMMHLSYCYSHIKNHNLSSQYADQALAIAIETQNKPSLALALAAKANVYWLRGEIFIALLLVFRSLIILPPWRSTNGQLIWHKLLERIKTQLPFLKKVLGMLVAGLALSRVVMGA